jgi:hypothetical protein
MIFPYNLIWKWCDRDGGRGRLQQQQFVCSRRRSLQLPDSSSRYEIRKRKQKVKRNNTHTEGTFLELLGTAFIRIHLLRPPFFEVVWHVERRKTSPPWMVHIKVKKLLFFFFFLCYSICVTVVNLVEIKIGGWDDLSTWPLPCDVDESKVEKRKKFKREMRVGGGSSLYFQKGLFFSMCTCAAMDYGQYLSNFC